MTDLHTDPGADLQALMARAMSDLSAPTSQIQEGALRRGRAARRRRRVGSTAGILAAAAVAAGIAWPTMAGTGDPDQLTAHDSTDPSPDVYVRPDGWWNMPGAEMQNRLEDLLAPGLTMTDANLGNEELAPGDEPQGGWIAVDLADSDGPAGGLNVVLYPPFDDDGAFVREQTTCPGNLVDPDTCTVLRDASGSPVGRVSRWRDGDVVVLAVTRLTAEGAVIVAGTSNSSDDKWGPGSTVERDAPPLRLPELRELVAAPTWRDWSDRA